MINKHGHGEVYFGVDDDGLVVGQIITNSAIKDLSETIYRDIEPRIIPTLEVMNLDGKNVLKVAFYGSNKPYNAHGKFLIRVGTQNRKMSRDELIKLVQDNNYSFDLARAIGKSKKIQRILSSLISKDYLLQVENNQYGYWKVKEKK